MNKEKLKIMQSYPLDMKIELTKRAILDFNNTYDSYIPFSGGKDSTVLAHIVYEECNLKLPLVHVNTKNEFKEIELFVNKMKENYNIEIVLPKKNMKDVINEYGYPVISKDVSNTIYYARKNILEGKNSIRVRQIMGEEKGSKFNKGKYKFLLDAPFKISHKCCDIIKKEPLISYEKRTNKRPITGELATESQTRNVSYLKHGCINHTKQKCQPLGFWTEQDILEYIYTRKIDICSVYGSIEKLIDTFYLTGEKRTGCTACILGMQFDKDRILRLKEIEPKKYDYVVNYLGFNKVLDFLNYKY